MSWWRTSATKSGLSRPVKSDQLHEDSFLTPPATVCAFLVVDVDRQTAVAELFDLPSSVRPSWVVETPKGAQAGWLIDPVDLRPAARERPRNFAAAVGYSLRSAVTGDEAVDPVRAPRVRNPACMQADVWAGSNPRVYQLRELHEGLQEAGLWVQKNERTFDKRRVMVDPGGAIQSGERNVRIFDACRFAAYRSGDYRAAAMEAYERCQTGVTASEVEGIIRSVERYMQQGKGARRSGRSGVPESVSERLRQFGRRGAATTNSKPDAQQWRATGAARSRATRSERASERAEGIRALANRGASTSAIQQILGLSRSTVTRALRAVSFTRPQVFRACPARTTYSPAVKLLTGLTRAALLLRKLARHRLPPPSKQLRLLREQPSPPAGSAASSAPVAPPTLPAPGTAPPSRAPIARHIVEPIVAPDGGNDRVKPVLPCPAAPFSLRSFQDLPHPASYFGWVWEVLKPGGGRAGQNRKDRGRQRE